jgi:hypothetical protein
MIVSKTVDRRQLLRQNTQIGATERTNVLLARIVALLETQHEHEGLPPIPVAADDAEVVKRGWFG